MDVQREGVPYDFDRIFQSIHYDFNSEYHCAGYDVDDIPVGWTGRGKRIEVRIDLGVLFCRCESIIKCDCDDYFEEVPFLYYEFTQKQFEKRKNQLSLF